MTAGVPVVFQDRWDSLEVLRLIQARRVTHVHLVPIMFQRLLAEPQRGSFDLSSLKYVMHGAAPCPPDVKRAMIEWLGPILGEYYAGSEGGGGFTITSEEWLKKPGSVGKLGSEDGTRVLDDEGNPVAPGEPGMLYFKVAAANPFEYFNDPEKTAASHRDGYFTLGDVGYFDEDGYLFLTGRTAECIISGGVNIYPQEVDNEFVRHPAVRETCTVGVPNDEWGEEVKAVIALYPGYTPSPELAKELLDFIRPSLAGYKMPRSVDFVDEIPRSEAGKVQRRQVRAPYWAGRDKQI
jgi:long-chain acyl-CoA synthetase